jgi:hypothetical protein
MSCLPCAEMKFQGTLSYLKSSENTVKLEDNSTLKISRINDEVARIFLTNPDDVQISIPVNFTFRNLTTGQIVESFRNEWLISWTAKYELKRDDETILNIDYQRQQAIRSRKCEIKDTTPEEKKKEESMDCVDSHSDA